ncbi:acyl-coenzyme A thioesterase 8-like [Gigantopelta aegis]|uniref:acyl-coenzyme A thioesterase 8-like n=1 Tax=Gigantopelta aegis TaxID=1735272 RepID=UPI001B88BBC4|nr:acyl-coenzyme A thioesterase 8-like [Gigantopelta aegis]
MNNSNGMSVDNKTDLDSIVTKAFLDLEEIEVNLYRGSNLFRPVGSRIVFGGQVVGQALVAAIKTLPPDYLAHSLHSYFLKGGSYEQPIVYHVDRTREGNTYCSRSVKAVQNGSPIFTMQASFKKEESDPFEHQFTMPHVPEPENLMNTTEILQQVLKFPNISQRQQDYIHKRLAEDITVEMRPANKDEYIMQKSLAPKQCTWVRAIGHIGDDVQMHQCVAAYISDTILLRAAILPAGMNNAVSPKRFMMMSLDHSIWFHNLMHTNEWMLYEAESPFCGGGRSLVLGRLWRRDGVLAMSVAQEGVIRTLKSQL